MTLRRRTQNYLRENWGAIFITAFVVLLFASAAELALGLNDIVNNTAIYAFFALVLGVALQIASYVKYGPGGSPDLLLSDQPGKPPSEPNPSTYPGDRRFLSQPWPKPSSK